MLTLYVSLEYFFFFDNDFEIIVHSEFSKKLMLMLYTKNKHSH